MYHSKKNLVLIAFFVSVSQTIAMQENIPQEARWKKFDGMRPDIISAIVSIRQDKFRCEVCKLKMKYQKVSSSLKQDDQRVFQDLAKEASKKISEDPLGDLKEIIQKMNDIVEQKR